MSKKNLKTGLESVFGISTSIAEVENPVEESVSFFVGKDDDGKTRTIVRKTTATGRSLSSKNFTSDLESLLQEAINDSVSSIAPSQTTNSEITTVVAKSRNFIRPPLSGLDALIRQTVETSIKTEGNTAEQQRITLIFDRKKLEKLKAIARTERAYLKDVVGKIISEFIDRYEISSTELT